MNSAIRLTSPSAVSPSSGSRVKTLMPGVRGLTPTPSQAHRRLPLLDQALLVVGGPGTVVVDQLDFVEGGCARRWRHVLADREAVRKLDVQLAGLFRQDPVDEHLR